VAAFNCERGAPITRTPYTCGPFAFAGIPSPCGGSRPFDMSYMPKVDIVAEPSRSVQDCRERHRQVRPLCGPAPGEGLTR
jgi:hypothetical protein